jgi:hypothetical protein
LLRRRREVRLQAALDHGLARDCGKGGSVGGFALENALGLAAPVSRFGAGCFHKILNLSLHFNGCAWLKAAVLPRYVHRASFHGGDFMSAFLAHRFTSAAQRVADDREELTLIVAPAPNFQFPARALDFDSLPQFARAVGSLFAAAGGAGFLDSLFDRFAGFARALLNPANQFFLLAFGVLEIVIRELGPLLFQLAFGDVPVAFDFECGHNSS